MPGLNNTYINKKILERYKYFIYLNIIESALLIQSPFPPLKTAYINQKVPGKVRKLICNGVSYLALISNTQLTSASNENMVLAIWL